MNSRMERANELEGLGKTQVRSPTRRIAKLHRCPEKASSYIRANVIITPVRWKEFEKKIKEVFRCIRGDWSADEYI